MGKDRGGRLQRAGFTNDGWAHVEKNEGDGRGWLRTAGGCRQTMSDVVMLYNLQNKRSAWEKKKKVKRIIKCSKY